MLATARKHTFSRNEDGTWNIARVCIFMTHTRGEDVFSQGRLHKMVVNTVKSIRSGGRPKIFIHHNGFQSSPTVGRLARLHVVGECVFADYTNLRPSVFREIARGGYPQRSVELDPTTLNAFDGIALLGSEEPYFPLPDLEVELTPEQWEQLDRDVAADSSFAHAYGRKDRREAHIYRFPARTRTMDKLYVKQGDAYEAAPALYRKNDSGEFVAYMLDPETAQEVLSIVEEATAPMKEAMSMLSIRVEALEQSSDTEKETEDASEEGDQPPPEQSQRENEDKKDEDEDEDESQSRREQDESDEDEEDEGKADSKRERQPESLESFEKRIKAEAELKALRTRETRGGYAREFREALDPAVYEDVDAEAERLAGEVMNLPAAHRERACKTIVEAYRRGGVPTNRLPKTVKNASAASAEEKARAYHRAHREVMGNNYLNMSEDDFVKAVKADDRGVFASILA